ncbi:12989_t:CDS:2 [Funneliformis geosporum]|nr:12989_t:CDS:2 [Funneliformis geosporum]
MKTQDFHHFLTGFSPSNNASKNIEVIFLPSYTPELNSIEKNKHLLKRDLEKDLTKYLNNSVKECLMKLNATSPTENDKYFWNTEKWNNGCQTSRYFQLSLEHLCCKGCSYLDKTVIPSKKAILESILNTSKRVIEREDYCFREKEVEINYSALARGLLKKYEQLITYYPEYSSSEFSQELRKKIDNIRHLKSPHKNVELVSYLNDGLILEKVTHQEKRQRITTKKMIREIIPVRVNYRVIFLQKTSKIEDADLVCKHCEYYEMN